MNFRKLITYLTMGTAAAMPLAVAQNPTILQGNYISNVFGNSNFVLNPNALTNVANVTNATRSTTTPLVATSEFTLSLASGANATWTLRAFDGGMKGQNCEARFTYRGFATATTKAEIVQNSLVVASLTLTPTTDPRIASINFPCGDLANLTTFRIAQTTANMTGTNEIGGIYVGLATNMANVAQASKVGGWDNFLCGAEPVLNTGTAVWSAPNVAGSCSGTPVGSASASLSNLNTLTFGFSNLPPGEYVLMVPVYIYPTTVTSGTARCDGRIKETTLGLLDNGNAFGFATTSSSLSIGQVTQFKFQNTTTANRIFQIELNRSNGLSNCSGGTLNFGQNVSLYRFPSSSELVVTPERQNVFASVKGISTGGSSNTVASSSWTKLTSSSTLTRTTFGKAKVESNNDYSITIENMPVGAYYVTVTGSMLTASAVSGSATVCFFGLADSATGGAQIASTQQNSTGDATSPSQDTGINTIGGVYQNTAVANRTFFLQAFRSAGTGGCYAWTDGNRPFTITVIPLDQPSNSALYVQGPVKAAETGAAIPSGYQMEGITAVSSTLTSQSNGAYKTGTGITLQPGVYLVTTYCSVAAVAPQNFVCGITKTVNTQLTNDDRNFFVEAQSTDYSNTVSAKRLQTFGYYKATTATTFYPYFYITAPVSSGYSVDQTISAIRLN